MTAQDVVKQLRANLAVSYGKCTQEDLARDLGVTVRTVARWEGDGPPTGDALVRLIHFSDAKVLPEVAAHFRRIYLMAITPKCEVQS